MRNNNMDKELGTWLDKQDLGQLEERFIKNYESAGYIIDDTFMIDYENEFADFVFATYEEETKK